MTKTEIIARVSALHPGYRIYGPYISADGRKRLTFRQIDDEGRVRKVGSRSFSMAWSRAKMTAKLNRLLLKSEEVDHKNEDYTNDEFSNLQVLTVEDHLRKSGAENTRRQSARTHEVCPCCEQKFLCRGDLKRAAEAKGRKPCCGRKCSSKMYAKNQYM